MSDLIRRSDAIEAVAKYISCDYPTISMAEEDAKDLINAIPSAQGRYIDADALVTVCLYDDEHEERYIECMSVEKCLDLLTEEGCPKTADRPQGEWIKDAEWWCVYKCSVCGETFDELTNFCPNCGARMKGADDE